MPSWTEIITALKIRHNFFQMASSFSSCVSYFYSSLRLQLVFLVNLVPSSSFIRSFSRVSFGSTLANIFIVVSRCQCYVFQCKRRGVTAVLCLGPYNQARSAIWQNKFSLCALTAINTKCKMSLECREIHSLGLECGARCTEAARVLQLLAKMIGQPTCPSYVL